MNESLVEWLEAYSYDNLLTEALDAVPNGLDKREGSVIYDAIAPACLKLAELYLNIADIILDTFPSSAIGEYLDLKAQEQGLERLPATTAINLAEFKDPDGNLMDVPLGSRFSTTNLTDAYVYQVLSKVSEGKYLLEAEMTGSGSNRYTGELLPLSNINGLGYASMSGNEISGREEESDTELRERYFATVSEKAFGGNVVSYIQESSAIEGVGDVQVYPTWDGVGSVGLQIVDNDNMPTSESVIDVVKKYFDPDDGSGTGIAPIGHTVTVNTPEVETIHISANVSISGSDITSVENEARASLMTYFREVQNEWGKPTELYQYKSTVYLARVMMALLQTPGITNVSNVRLNGVDADVVFDHEMTSSTMPTLGNVGLVNSP